MSKIIIENQSSKPDAVALKIVLKVMEMGFVSGSNQYCWVTRSRKNHLDVLARKTRGNTHSFVVMDIASIDK